jgi:hypothetical protein
VAAPKKFLEAGQPFDGTLAYQLINGPLDEGR